MPPTKGDHPVNREDPTQPDQPAVNGTVTEALGTPTAASGPTPTKHNTAPGFDPWRFGTHDVSAELRQEILEKGFPDTPDDELFTNRHKADDSKPKSPLPLAPDVIDADDPYWDADRTRRADTLRLHRKPAHPSAWRAAAPWLVISAVGVFVLLWLLVGRDEPKPPTGAVEVAPAKAPEATAKWIEPSLNAPSPPVVKPSSASDVAPAAPDASAPPARPESRPAKPKEPSSPRTASPPRAPDPGTPRPPTPPAPKPSSSRWVPADD